MRVGILGGTFNPPHLGHLVCGQEAYLQLELNRVVLMPVHVPPHKEIDDEPGFEHRVEMCRLAVAEDRERFGVSDLEGRRPGPSYTVDTLAELHDLEPESELFLIVGADIALGFPSWREPERVLSMATLAIAQRPGTARSAVERAITSVPGGEAARFFDMPEIGISSTLLRERARSGEPTRYLVPDSVRAYIDRFGLYRGRPEG